MDVRDDFDLLVDAFGNALDQCHELYANCGEEWINVRPDMSDDWARGTREKMRDLGRGLTLKVFLAIVEANKRFSYEERRLAQVLLARGWGRQFATDEVGEVLQGLLPFCDSFNWYALVRPFEEVPVLRNHVGQLETVVMRLANIIAKADGQVGPEEALQLKGIQAEIARHLRPVALEPDDVSKRKVPSCDEIRSAIDKAPAVGRQVATEPSGKQTNSAAVAADAKSREERLKNAMDSLEQLIGLQSIKTEVRELVRFLKVQRERASAGLPETRLGLHCVFSGNPGTGKTTVARLLGELLGALGIVAKGHLVETDRSSLIAGYMGQTAEKTNKVCDAALDGVLFIDEAYSLISGDGDDPYGHEAVQILLKRMEDDRDRLVVVLAGYPEPTERLLLQNPGLGSRFQRTFRFPDYSAVELCRIFETMCKTNHYELPAATRGRLLVGFDYLVRHRDEYFGNGRLARNVFELAIRRLANRVADVAPLTKELLTRVEPIDIEMVDVPPTAFAKLESEAFRFNLSCPGCSQRLTIKTMHLGRQVKCKKCDNQFEASWGEVAT